MMKSGEWIFMSEIIEKHRIGIEVLYPSKIIRLTKVKFPFYRIAMDIRNIYDIKLKEYDAEHFEIALKTFVAWRKIYQKITTPQTLINELRDKILKEIQ